MKNKKSRNDDRNFKQLGVFITIPFVLSVPPVVGWFLGSYIDQFFDTKPFIMYVCIFVGMLSGFAEVYRMIKRYGNES